MYSEIVCLQNVQNINKSIMKYLVYTRVIQKLSNPYQSLKYKNFELFRVQ